MNCAKLGTAILMNFLKKIIFIASKTGPYMVCYCCLVYSSGNAIISANLCFISCQQHVDIASLLIKFNTCVNAVDKWGFTPLHEAAQKGRTQLCTLLVCILVTHYTVQPCSILFGLMDSAFTIIVNIPVQLSKP
jgi:Ankyrin repeats (many copies)